jgi:hypothetical protein
MHIRCSYCNQSFNLNRDFVAQAIAEAEDKDQKYYGVECINCRKLIKVPLDQMRRAVPDYAETPAESSDEAES